jgi:XisI protein
MDKLSDYRQIIQDIFTAHSQIQPVYGDIEMELLFDIIAIDIRYFVLVGYSDLFVAR